MGKVIVEQKVVITTERLMDMLFRLANKGLVVDTPIILSLTWKDDLNTNILTLQSKTTKEWCSISLPTPAEYDEIVAGLSAEYED